jgi:YegS/Rv2252/BmrU family lipid kinase
MADPGRSLAVLVNPAAGGGRALKALPAIRAELDRLGADYRVIETEDAAHARSEAAACAAAGQKVAAVGGDGLIGTIAGDLCGSDVPLAILPGGRGNDLARVLGIPTDPAAAARVAVEGEERAIDVGEANGKTFVGIASMGVDSDANRIANEAKLVKGNLVYLYAAVRALVQWRDASFEVVVDGRRHTFRGCQVAVGNSKAYGGGMYALPQAELDDGLLDVLITTHAPKPKLMWLTMKSFSGSHVDDPVLRFMRGREVEVSADRQFDVYADGDPVASTPVRIRAAERVLRVMVPPSR